MESPGFVCQLAQHCVPVLTLFHLLTGIDLQHHPLKSGLGWFLIGSAHLLRTAHNFLTAFSCEEVEHQKKGKFS